MSFCLYAHVHMEPRRDVSIFATKQTWIQSLGLIWQKERTNFYMLSSDLHTSTIQWHIPFCTIHIPTGTWIENIIKFLKEYGLEREVAWKFRVPDALPGDQSSPILVNLAPTWGKLQIKKLYQQIKQGTGTRIVNATKMYKITSPAHSTSYTILFQSSTTFRYITNVLFSCLNGFCWLRLHCELCTWLYFTCFPNNHIRWALRLSAWHR